jgi:hypothetical protein
MRKTIIAALAASAIAVPAYAADVMLPPAAPFAPPPPAAAAPTVAGYVGVYGGVVTDFSAAIAAAAADAAIAMSRQRMDIELELRYQGVFTGGGAIHLAAAMVHAYRRNADRAVGAFGGYEAVVQTTLANVFHLGAEAAMFRSRATIYAQLAGVFLTGGGTTGWGAYARGVARFFPRDNVKLEGGVRYLYLNTGGAGSVITPEMEGEFQLPGRSISFVGTFRGTFILGVGGTSVYTALAGIRFNFGGGDLIDQGAPMDTNPLVY